LDLFFKITPISDHVANFRGDRLRDRGDLALNKTRSSAVAEGPRDVHVIVKFSYVVTEYA